jgi:hypothetical protein
LLAAAVLVNGDHEVFMREAVKAIEATTHPGQPTWQSQE